MMNDDTNDTPEARPSPLAARRQPSKRASDMRGIGSVMVVCVVLFACLFGGIAGLNGFGSWAKANDAEATATAKSDDATATVMFAPTPETPEQRVQRLIKDAVYKGSVRQITVNADGVTIDMTGTAHSDLAEMRDGIYRDVLNIMARIFTSHMNPKAVTVNVYDPVYDQYGKATDTLYATATLTAQTATKFNWDYLSAHLDLTWQDYDKAWMIDSLANA